MHKNFTKYVLTLIFYFRFYSWSEWNV